MGGVALFSVLGVIVQCKIKSPKDKEEEDNQYKKYITYFLKT